MADTRKTTRRKSRYGKLTRGWGWRTLPEFLERAERFIKEKGLSKTELIERAIEEYMERNRK